MKILNPQQQNSWKDIDGLGNEIQFDNGWTKVTGDGSAQCNTAGAKATLNFNGTSVRWYGQTDSNFGKAEVWIDNALVSTIDTYSSTNIWNILHYENTNLSSGEHTITIVPIEQGKYIDIDLIQYK